VCAFRTSTTHPSKLGDYSGDSRSPNYFQGASQPWYLHDWVVLANCRPSTPLVFLLCHYALLPDQSTTNPEV